MGYKQTEKMEQKMTNKNDMPEVIYCAALPNGKLEARYGSCNKGFPITTKYVRADTRPVPEQVVEALKKVLPLVKYLGEAEPNPEFDEMMAPKLKNIQESVENALSLLTAQEGKL